MFETLSQRDPRWSKRTLGFTRSTIGSLGCTLTALTCLLNREFNLVLTPDQVNDRLKSVKAFSDGQRIGAGNLIVWARVPLAFKDLFYPANGRHNNYNNAIVAYYVYVKSMPVMVEVNGAKIGGRKHWVLFIGNGQAVDPWTGKIISTSYYPLTGYALFDRA